ncbi:MAG: leucine-rich repeat domain-containing protein [Prevotella sp.]|nr:leucine-rich repeat domain-containing protein [Prevotella sp.]
MKTKILTLSYAGSKFFFLLTILLWMAGTMSVQATDYDLWVGGKRVTSSNANNITNSTIDGATGAVTYNASQKALYLRDVSIECVGSNSTKQGIYNKGIEGLRIFCSGETNIHSDDNAGLQCDVETKVFVDDGITWIDSDNSRAVYINGTSCSLFCEGKLYITGYQCPAIEGVSSSSGKVNFYGKNIDVEGKKGDLVNLYSASFKGLYHHTSTITWTYGCDVTLEKTGSSTYPCVKNVSKFYGTKSNFSAEDLVERYAIVTYPASADFNSSKKSVCDTSANPIYVSDIHVNEDFATVVNNYFFPDTNFRNYLKNSFGTFVSKSQMNNTTTLNLANKSIADLTGIQFFTELKELYLYNNQLTQLDLSKNTKLTRLECPYNRLTTLDVSLNTQLIGVICDDNQLTSLKVPHNNLQWLSCNNNQLGYCLTNNTHTKLKELYCAYNTGMTSLGAFLNDLPELEKFDCSGTSILDNVNLIMLKKLKELTCENMPNLWALQCSNTALTKLSVSGCSNLRYLTCNDNKLTYLNVYGCTALSDLHCENNLLANIAYLSSCQLLKSLYISSNKLTSLDVSGLEKLTELYCNNNQLTSLAGLTNRGYLQKVDCSGNQLTSLSMGNNDLRELKCNNNRLSTLTLSNHMLLSTLDCSYNPTLTSLDLSTGLSTLSEVNCSHCDLRSINWKNLKFTTIDCSYNSNLTSLNNSRDDNTVRPLSSLNVKGCTKLEELRVWNNQLTAIDLSSCVKLWYLDLDGNALTSLNVDACTDLKYLYCISNQLTTLNLSNNRKLCYLSCSDNNLSSLNVKNFTDLRSLNCSYNQLTSLDLRGCNALEHLDCSDNQISSLILPQENTTLNEIICYTNCLDGPLMDVMIGSLPDRKNLEQGQISMLTDFNSEGNVCTWQNVRDARSKNWNVLYWNTDYGEWVPYSGSGVPTAITTAEADNDGDAPRYNMSGQRVGHDYKGVVIVNGKKKVVK